MIRRFASIVALSALLLVATHAIAEDSYFDSDGVKIHYVVEGAGEPVVLIHGFTANIELQWKAPGILSKLQEDYKVVALDNRGHGKSEKPHDPEQYGPEMIGDVLRLMDHLDIAKAHVVGYSMGGFMTNYLLNNHPERVVTATLGGAGWAKADDQRTEFMDVLADSLDSGKGIGPLIEQLTPAGRPKPSQQQIDLVNQMVLAHNDPKALAACIRGLRDLTVTAEQLKANEVPTLCLIGSDDPLKIGVDELEPVMSNVTVEVIEGADHMTAFASAKFIGDLEVFLEDHAPVAVGAGGK